MKRNTDFSDIFDDDFEVTYEDIWDDVPASYRRRPRSDRHADYEAAHKNDDSYEDDSIYEDDDTYENQKNSMHVKDPRPSRRRSKRGVPLAAPIRKGGRVLSRAAAVSYTLSYCCPDTGDISICGIHILAGKHAIRRYCGILPYAENLYDTRSISLYCIDFHTL